MLNPGTSLLSLHPPKVEPWIENEVSQSAEARSSTLPGPAGAARVKHGLAANSENRIGTDTGVMLTVGRHDAARVVSMRLVC